MLNKCKFITLAQKIEVQINWVQNNNFNIANTEDLVQLEYKFRGKMFSFLIHEAEHLVDYIGNVSIRFDIDVQVFSVSEDTPEPFLSLLRFPIDVFNLENHIHGSAVEIDK